MLMNQEMQMGLLSTNVRRLKRFCASRLVEKTLSQKANCMKLLFLKIERINCSYSTSGAENANDSKVRFDWLDESDSPTDVHGWAIRTILSDTMFNSIERPTKPQTEIPKYARWLIFTECKEIVNQHESIITQCSSVRSKRGKTLSAWTFSLRNPIAWQRRVW